METQNYGTLHKLENWIWKQVKKLHSLLEYRKKTRELNEYRNFLVSAVKKHGIKTNAKVKQQIIERLKRDDKLVMYMLLEDSLAWQADNTIEAYFARVKYPMLVNFIDYMLGDFSNNLAIHYETGEDQTIETVN